MQGMKPPVRFGITVAVLVAGMALGVILSMRLGQTGLIIGSVLGVVIAVRFIRLSKPWSPLKP